VKFIVIDEQQDQQQYQLLPVSGINNDDGPGGNQPFMWICLIAIFSLFAGTAYHFLSKLQKLA
jgi:hypothetical protein